MRNFLSATWRILCSICSFVTPIAVFLYFALQVANIKYLEKKQIEATDQIVETQIAIYDALVQTQAANLITQEQLAKGIDQAKKDAIKNNDQVMKVIYGVDKRSLTRDQDIVNGVNKVVDDVSYALQKPSYDYLKNITVMLMAKAEDFDTAPKGLRGWLGTGVVVAVDKDFTYILTNRHVAQDEDNGKKFHIFVKDGEDLYPVTTLKISKDDNIDLALVRINGHIDGKRAVIGFGPAPEPQDPVYLVGHNLGRPFFYAEGTVSGYDPDENYDLVTNMPTGPGNSGSGIINKDGQLVGLLYAGSVIDQEGVYEMDTSHGICVNIKAIRLFLAGYIEQ